ncbi:asparagine synthase (glutamine-hydrolyzing) [candidate division KSB1 bacterium]|nr:asparagine synthase (glutamine-hydrolyzing) [candidate division KSB1 bacterium]
MCGIFGLWHFDRQPLNPVAIQQATTLLRHRGPDDEGYLFVDTAKGCVSPFGGNDTIPQLGLPRLENALGKSFDLAFGFRRLSIIDLSPAGHQPMAGADGRLWIIYNGEIYNYLELRSELAGYGHQFRTNTDTEVIVAAYQQWGDECLSRFNGMWAFALWDMKQRELFCARDRLGVKPFYYYFDGTHFIFASEIKAILAAAREQARKINHPYLANFLLTGLLDHDSQTFFAPIKALAPAHCLKIGARATTLTPKRYWDIIPEALATKYDYARPENTFLNLLRDAVRLRLRSDVPVGTCLSGGLDSSAIVTLASKMLPHAINSFSSIYSHPGYSEEHFIRLVAQANKTQAHFASPDPEKFFALLGKVIWHMDEPAAGPGIYSQWFVMELAKPSVTVLLDGQGGDELFAGYAPYLPLHLLSLGRKILRKHRPALLWKFLQDGSVILRNGHRYFFPDLSLRQFLQKVVTRVSGRRYCAGLWLNADMAEAQRALVISSHNPISPQDPLNRRLYRDLTQTSIPALLHYEDRNSMAFGLEARAPFLDYRLVEFALGLPGEMKIKGATTKYIVRNALKNVLPEAVRTRRDKMGYPTPLALWLAGPLRSPADAMLQEHFHRRNFYNTPMVQRIWREHQTGAADHSWQIFRWLTTEAWLQNFIDT